MRRKIASFIRRFSRDRSGNVLIMTAVAMTTLLGVGGFAVDVSHVIYVKNRVQEVTDAAALAAAQDIGDGQNSTTISNTATSYSAVAGNKGAYAAMPVTMVSGYPLLKCLTNTGVPCNPGSSSGSLPNGANAIVVKQQATVPLYLGRVLGFNTMTVTATATASAAGGQPPPLNVMFVLDTTTSMKDPGREIASADPACSATSARKIDCALAGMRTILPQLWPSIDYIGLSVFPGVATVATDVPKEYDCSSSTKPTVVAYNHNPAPVYQIMGLSSGIDYKTSDTASTLNTSSNLVKEVGGGGTTCSGLDVIGGQSTFFADAIHDAKAKLTAGARTGAQNVIILLSDGDANASTAPTNTNECHQAITAAAAATAAGTWVYSIAYGAKTSSSCSTDTGTNSISACSTMQQIAVLLEILLRHRRNRRLQLDGKPGVGPCRHLQAHRHDAVEHPVDSRQHGVSAGGRTTSRADGRARGRKTRSVPRHGVNFRTPGGTPAWPSSRRGGCRLRPCGRKNGGSRRSRRRTRRPPQARRTCLSSRGSSPRILSDAQSRLYVRTEISLRGHAGRELGHDPLAAAAAKGSPFR